jgi:hypothetical protein
MFSETRTWKWAVPGAIVVLLIPVTGKMMASENTDMQYWAMVPLGFCVLALAVGLSNYWKWATTHKEDMFAEHQTALSITPLVLLAKSMQQMHPEAVRVLDRFGVRTSWDVDINVINGVREFSLKGLNVHFGFIEFVISHSGRVLYPKNRFSEGSKKWDPEGIIEDREQYAELESWLFSRLMVTRSHGEYKPAEFIPPWTPELILKTMGLTGEQELYKPEDMNGNGVTKQLPAEERSAPVQKTEVRKPENVRELDEEALAGIQAENERYAKLYADGKIPQ